MLKNLNSPINKNVTYLSILKQVLLFMIGLGGLTIIQVILQLGISSIASLASKTTLDYQNFIRSTTFSMLLNGLSYFILFLIFLILLRKDTDELFKSFKGWKPYVFGLVGFLAILNFNLVYNIILTSAGVSISDNANESALNSIVKDFPFLSILIFAIIGPICEELTYRVGLFSLLKRANRWLAYGVTIVVFTLIHFDFSGANLVNELLNIPFYTFAAITFSFLYERFGFASSMSAHITNNLFSLIATIISGFR